VDGIAAAGLLRRESVGLAQGSEVRRGLRRGVREGWSRSGGGCARAAAASRTKEKRARIDPRREMGAQSNT